MREHDAGPAMMRAQLHTALLATMASMVLGGVAVTKNSGARHGARETMGK
jgi:hypothetical protein